MNFGQFTPSGQPQQPLPSNLTTPESSTHLLRFTTLCAKTSSRILHLLALGLSIAPDFFSTRHDPLKGETGSILRWLYYPSRMHPATKGYVHSGEEKERDVRAGAHSDYGSVTLLFQRRGQAGLEILPPEEKGAEWVDVPVYPSGSEGKGEGKGGMPPILVNIGDLLSYWTDGLLKSTVHRVVFPSDDPDPQDRYSIVYFCHPLDSTELVPVPSEIVREYRERHGHENGDEKVGFGGGAGSWNGERPLTAKEHLEGRLDATYGFKRV